MTTRHVEVERRVNRWTLGIGGIAAAITWVAFTPRSAAGVLAGSVLAWLNAKWMQEALDSLTAHTRQQGAVPSARVSVWTWVKFFGRYGLMAAVIYVMFKYFDVPVVSILCGLLALGAAILAEFAYERTAPSK
jgi:hypothetical protein